MIKNITRILFLLLFFLVQNFESNAATYYSKISSGTDANSLSNWSLNTDGSGGAPADWANSFVIQSGHTMSMSATWGDGSSSMDLTINSGGSLNLNGRTLSSVLNSLTVSGTGNAAIGAIYNGSATTATIEESITLGANTTFITSSGDITISGGLETAGFTFTFDGSNDYIVSGIISGTGSIIQTCTSNVALSGTNTYSGLTTINATAAGAMTISNASALGTSAAGVVITTGVLELTNNITIVNEALTISTTLMNGSGNNTWTGNITVVTNGAIIQSSSGTTLTLSGNIDISASNIMMTLQGASTNSNNVTGIVTGAGGIKKSGTGTWLLSNANTFTGGVLLHNGTLGVNNAQALGTDTLTITQGTPGNILNLSNTSGADITHNNILISINNNFRFVGTNNLNLGSGNVFLTADVSCAVLSNYTLTIEGVISGAYAFSKTNTGTLILTGTNTYTGATNVNAGTLQITNSQGTGATSGGVSVASGATLALSGGIAVGNESLTLNGSGLSTGGALRNISGNNSWAGAITLSTNATRINSDANTLTLSNTITNNAIDLTIGGAGDCVVNGVIGSGAGAFVKDGAGTVYLNATNTYTGATTVNNGTVLLGANQVLSNNLTITSGEFDVNASNYSLSLTGNFSNSDVFTSRNGTVTFNGSSAQTISGTADAAFYNLTINNSSTGVSLGVNTSITNTLDFTDGILSAQGYDLTIGTNSSNGSITNANSSNYIVAFDNSGTIGEVIRNVNANGSYVFPIGDNSNYTPITVTLNSNSALSNANISMYTKADVIDEMSPSVTTYLQRQWQTSQSGITDPNYDVSYTYVAADVNGTESDILPLNYNGVSSWQKPTGSLFTTGTEVGTGSINTGTRTLAWSGVSALRKLGGAGNASVPLPITLIHFSTKNAGSKNVISWSTASEVNNDFFTIERSVDGFNFKDLNVVKSKSLGNNVCNYEFFDENIQENNSFYYRLKQTDYDGTFSYSSIVFVKTDSFSGEKNLIHSFDFNGKSVENQKNNLRIDCFSDGSSIKVYEVE